ncbi:MAG TPA: hypothetical protein VFT50_09370 [Baekduia sp.]|nr:hypothetical protein [Baekduia sp.]
MSYTFDPDSGATRAQLVDLCTSQAFSSSRYGEMLKAWLNDGVLEVCRRLSIVQGAALCDFDADGIVTQPAAPFFKVREVWLCTTGATGSTERAVRAAARYQLAPLDPDVASLVDRGVSLAQPLRYAVRRTTAAAGAGRSPSMQIVVEPGGSAGTVGVIGLQRPPVMSADTDVTGLGADFDDAVVAFAKSRAFRQEDDTEMAAFWRAEFDLALRANLEVGVDDGPIITPGVEDC